MNQELLKHIGLSDNEARVYTALLRGGVLSVSALTKQTKIKRSNLYHVTEALTKKGVIVKMMRHEVAHFQATDPEKLLILVEQQEEQLRHHREALELTLPDLKSLFHLSTQQPSVRSYEGIDGLKKIYEDILKQGKDIRLIRSVLDNNQAKLAQLVKRQIAKQVRAGIHARILAPLMPSTPAKILERDKSNLVERRIMPRDQFTLPSQVMLYGNTVALTDFDHPDTIISTVIENRSIAKTFGTLFEYIWEHSKEEHDLLYASISDDFNG